MRVLSGCYGCMASGALVFIVLSQCPVPCGRVYPGFWVVAVLAVVICLVSLKGKSSVVPSLVWGVRSW